MLLGHHRCSTGTCGVHVVQLACCRRPVCSICDSDWYCHKCGLCKQVMCTMLWGVLKAVSAGRCLCFRSNPFQLVLYRQALRLNTSAPAAEPHTFSVQANPCLQASSVNRGGSGYACVSCAIHSYPLAADQQCFGTRIQPLLQCKPGRLWHRQNFDM